MLSKNEIIPLTITEITAFSVTNTAHMKNSGEESMSRKISSARFSCCSAGSALVIYVVFSTILSCPLKAKPASAQRNYTVPPRPGAGRVHLFCFIEPYLRSSASY